MLCLFVIFMFEKEQILRADLNSCTEGLLTCELVVDCTYQLSLVWVEAGVGICAPQTGFS